MARHDVNAEIAQKMYDEDVQNGTNRYGTFDGRSLLEQKGDIRQDSGDKLTANPLIYRKESTDYRIDGLVERGNISDYNITPVAALQKDANDIRVIQAFLRESGYYKGKFDGYGPETEKAVKAFQKQAKLAQDGDVGTDTYGAMGFNYVKQADDGKYHPVEDDTYKKYLALADWYEQYDAGNAAEQNNAYYDNNTKRSKKENRASNVITENAQYIKNAGEKFGVNPAILASCIYAEHALNVDWVDGITDGIGGFYGLNTSVGPAQVRVETAKFLEDNGYMPKITATDGGWNVPFIGFVNGTETMARSKMLENSEINIMYAAAYLAYLQDRWRDAYPEIDGRTAILATLYNQKELRPPHGNPGSNDFGKYAKENYAYMRNLLGLE